MADSRISSLGSSIGTGVQDAYNQYRKDKRIRAQALYDTMMRSGPEERENLAVTREWQDSIDEIGRFADIGPGNIPVNLPSLEQQKWQDFQAGIGTERSPYPGYPGYKEKSTSFTDEAIKATEPRQPMVQKQTGESPEVLKQKVKQEEGAADRAATERLKKLDHALSRTEAADALIEDYNNIYTERKTLGGTFAGEAIANARTNMMNGLEEILSELETLAVDLQDRSVQGYARGVARKLKQAASDPFMNFPNIFAEANKPQLMSVLSFNNSLIRQGGASAQEIMNRLQENYANGLYKKDPTQILEFHSYTLGPDGQRLTEEQERAFSEVTDDEKRELYGRGFKQVKELKLKQPEQGSSGWPGWLSMPSGGAVAEEDSYLEDYADVDYD